MWSTPRTEKRTEQLIEADMQLCLALFHLRQAQTLLKPYRKRGAILPVFAKLRSALCSMHNARYAVRKEHHVQIEWDDIPDVLKDAIRAMSGDARYDKNVTRILGKGHE